MNKKVVLIRPENIYNYNNYPALNLISLASSLVHAGFEVRIINCCFEKDPLSAISAEFGSALCFGITLLTSEVPDAYRIMEYIKKNSKVPVIAGGWHCTLFADQMGASPLVDYVIEGEGEEHIVEIVRSLRRGQRPPSKVFRKKIVDLNTLPAPDYTLDASFERFCSSYLTDKLSEVVCQPMRWLPYESSRGCPSLCTFCINVVANNTRYRMKSAEKVIGEITELARKHRLTHLKIIDDNFFVDITRVRRICEGIIANGLTITWDGECRCDYFNDRMINDDTLRLLKRSGLVQLTLGIESGSPHTLGLMKKGITPEIAEFAVKQCDKHGIIARSSFILEIPGESLDDIKQTIRLVNRLRGYKHFTCGVGTFRPYPRCELTLGLLKKGYLKEPGAFDEWIKPEVINMYTSAEYIRPWQVNGSYSEKAAFYLNIESSARLGDHQIDRVSDRIRNRIFRWIARLRNRAMFYGLSIDKSMYKDFLVGFYKRRKSLEKSGSYPLSTLAKEN